MSKPTKPAAGTWVIPDTWRDIDSIPETPPAPHRYSRPVSWGDCDPAQIAYTGNVPKWCLVAIESWVKACFGINWYELNLDHGMGTPFVHLEHDFKSPVTARDRLVITVHLERAGTSSMAFRLEGHQGDRLCFVGNYANVLVEAKTIKPLPFPPNMRKALDRFLQRQNAAAE